MFFQIVETNWKWVQARCSVPGVLYLWALPCRWATSQFGHSGHLERRCSTCLPFSFVSRLLYLSFYNCVPDADMSINKLGAPCAPAEPNHVYVEGCERGRASGPFAARAQVESRCVTKHQWNFKTSSMTRIRFVYSDLYYPHTISLQNLWSYF